MGVTTRVSGDRAIEGTPSADTVRAMAGWGVTTALLATGRPIALPSRGLIGAAGSPERVPTCGGKLDVDWS